MLTSLYNVDFFASKLQEVLYGKKFMVGRNGYECPAD